MSADPRIVILGAGPCGLGAGYRLSQLGYHNWEIYEQNNYLGGLAASFIDAAGFTWDIGGHVLFTRDERFRALYETLMQGEYTEHVREAWIWMGDRYVPYPFQNNLRHLPKAVQDECLAGLSGLPKVRDRQHFAAWIEGTFGTGIARHFMRPYNGKVWAHPLEMMSADWIADRVPVVSYETVKAAVDSGQDETDWGPNNLFKFPLRGGTADFYRRLAVGFMDKLHLNRSVAQVEETKKQLRFADGDVAHYDYLISTLPLDRLVGMTSSPAEIKTAAADLVHSRGTIVGLGLRGPLPESLKTKCWIYFPAADVPFYRATVFSNYSPHHAPAGCWSLMLEISAPSDALSPGEDLVQRCIEALRPLGILAGSEIISRWLHDVGYSYPIPTLNRDRVLSILEPYLLEHHICSRGRFGAWRYEIGNMDHAVMMGWEAVDRILNGTPETVWG